MIHTDIFSNKKKLHNMYFARQEVVIKY